MHNFNVFIKNKKKGNKYEFKFNSYQFKKDYIQILNI